MYAVASDNAMKGTLLDPIVSGHYPNVQTGTEGFRLTADERVLGEARYPEVVFFCFSGRRGGPAICTARTPVAGAPPGSTVFTPPATSAATV